MPAGPGGAKSDSAERPPSCHNSAIRSSASPNKCGGVLAERHIRDESEIQGRDLGNRAGYHMRNVA